MLMEAWDQIGSRPQELQDENASEDPQIERITHLDTFGSWLSSKKAYELVTEGLGHLKGQFCPPSRTSLPCFHPHDSASSEVSVYSREANGEEWAASVWPWPLAVAVESWASGGKHSTWPRFHATYPGKVDSLQDHPKPFLLEDWGHSTE